MFQYKTKENLITDIMHTVAAGGVKYGRDDILLGLALMTRSELIKMAHTLHVPVKEWT